MVTWTGKRAFFSRGAESEKGKAKMGQAKREKNGSPPDTLQQRMTDLPQDSSNRKDGNLQLESCNLNRGCFHDAWTYV
jgi:hypothetical protein